MCIHGSTWLYLTPVKTVDLQPLCLAWVTGGGGRAGRGPPGESGRREAAESRDMYMQTNCSSVGSFIVKSTIMIIHAPWQPSSLGVLRGSFSKEAGRVLETDI